MKNKPTLTQLKKRPALWLSEFGYCYISHPSGMIEVYARSGVTWRLSDCDHTDLIDKRNWKHLEFVSWL